MKWLKYWLTAGIGSNCLWWGPLSVGWTLPLSTVVVGVSYHPSGPAVHIFLLIIRVVVLLPPYQPTNQGNNKLPKPETEVRNY